MSKTKTELSKMTKRNLLLHIENMQLTLENGHLETQRANTEMQEIQAKYKGGTPANMLEKICKAGGQLRYDLVNMNFSSPEDKQKVIKMVDNFIDTMV